MWTRCACFSLSLYSPRRHITQIFLFSISFFQFLFSWTNFSFCGQIQFPVRSYRKLRVSFYWCSVFPVFYNKACKSTAKYASFHFLISAFDRLLILLLFWPLHERETNRNGNRKLMLFSDPWPKQPYNQFGLTCTYHLYLWDQSQGHNRNRLVNRV